MVSPDKKAQALAGLAAGKTVRQVAKETGLSVGTIGRLRTSVPEQLERIGTEQQMTFGGLLASHFKTQVEALNAYAKHTASEEYIRSQPASEIASLHSSIAGHVTRVLDIASRVGALGQSAEADA